jgi:hypothetical protein
LYFCAAPKGRDRGQIAPGKGQDQRNRWKGKKGANMLWTICVIFLVLWALGLLTGYTMGGVIHALLVIAIIVVLVRVLQGRRPVV